MKILYVADLHYSLKQFDWLLANAGPYDVAAIGGDLLDVGGALDPDVVVEKYLKRLRRQTRLLVVGDGPVSRAELEKLLNQAATRVAGKWIWIHHAPPDRSPVSWTGSKFAGDKYLVEWIRRFGPDLVLSGHIHNAPFYPDGSWIDRIGKTWVFNPGRQIGPRPTSIVFDLGAMTAEWFSLESESLKRLAIDSAEISARVAAAGDT